ncbi:30S ribosomal protein S21, partial [bacterium]|nr:30S ribosomal protein S21 [bacterium]
KALRRLKKKIDREGIIKDARAKRGFEKPAERRRRKKKVKNFNAYLRKKWDNV